MTGEVIAFIVVGTFTCAIAIVAIIEQHKTAKRANEIQVENYRVQTELLRLQIKDSYLTWDDVDNFVRIIVQKIDSDGFMPDIVLALYQRDAIVASRICEKLKDDIPLFVGTRVVKKHTSQNKVPKIPGMNFFFKGDPTDTLHYVPASLPINETSRVLLVRDCSLTGDTFKLAISHLTENYHVADNNIKRCCIASAENPNRTQPEYYGRKVAHDIYFPWGRNIGNVTYL